MNPQRMMMNQMMKSFSIGRFGVTRAIGSQAHRANFPLRQEPITYTRYRNNKNEDTRNMAAMFAASILAGTCLSACEEPEQSHSDVPEDSFESLDLLVKMTELERMLAPARAKNDDETFSLLSDSLHDIVRGMTTHADVLHHDKVLCSHFIVNTRTHYDLIIEEGDALLLGLTCPKHGHDVMIDGEKVHVVEYQPVTLYVKLGNGTQASAHVTPVSFVRNGAGKKVDSAAVHLRVIGGGALHKMGLRQDQNAQTLVLVPEVA